MINADNVIQKQTDISGKKPPSSLTYKNKKVDGIDASTAYNIYNP